MPELIIESNMTTKKLKQEEEAVLSKYSFLTSIVPDKGVNVHDMPNTIKKLMLLKNLQYEDLQEVYY